MSKVLDSLEVIKSVDRSGMLEIQAKHPDFYEEAGRIAEDTPIPTTIRIGLRTISYGTPEKVLVLGVGGSAIGGEVLREWLLEISDAPVIVHRDYGIPAFADENTMVFAVSYSGNTEETLSGFVQAIRRGCMVVAVSSGGALSRWCTRLRIPWVRVPEGIPPRSALPYLFTPLMAILARQGLGITWRTELRKVVEALKRLRSELSPEKPLEKNPAKAIAQRLFGRIPIAYAAHPYFCAAQRLKAQLNENAKVFAKAEAFPELNHNEIVGWEKPFKELSNAAVVVYRDGYEKPWIAARIEATLEQVAGIAADIIEIRPVGEEVLARMLSAIYLGDYASLYLAVLRSIDPYPVESIAKLKQRLAEKVRLVESLEKQVGELASSS